MTKEETKNNLIRFDSLPKEKHRELSRKGGIKSGESRAERRALKEELNILLSDGDLQQRVCLALIDKALQGNERAFAILRDSLGEREADTLELIGGASLEKFRESHKMEIMDLLRDETRRKLDGKPPLYGNLAHCLSGTQAKNIVLRQIMAERNIIDSDASTVEEPRE